VKEKNLTAVHSLVKDLMYREEALADGACRCYGQTCRYLADDDFQEVIDEQVDIDDDLNWKEIRTKCWILCEVLQSCPERLSDDDWKDIGDFIEEIADRPEQPLENLIVEISYRRVEGLSFAGLTDRVPEAMRILLSKKGLVQGDAAIDLAENIMHLAQKNRDVVDQFLQQYAELLISLCCRHEQDIKLAAIVALQIVLDLKTTYERYEKLLSSLDGSNASVLKRVCKTIRY